MAKLSVVMPVYNGEKYLKEAVYSILNQTFKDFELIVVNDGSIDQTAEILKSFKDKRLVVVENSTNIGIARSLNKGLEIARGEYIARCDADDINAPERFEKQVRFLEENKEHVLVGSNCILIDEETREIGTLKTPETDRQIRTMIIVRNPVIHSSVMYRARLVKKTKGYRSLFNGAEDYDLWFRLLRYGKFHSLQENLIKRRIHNKAVTRRTSLYVGHSNIRIEVVAFLVRFVNLLHL